MKIVRYADSPTADGQYGIVKDGIVYAATGSLFDGLTAQDAVGAVDAVTLLAPIVPGKVLAIGLNYLDHVTENDPTRSVPTEPVVFMKPPSALIGPDTAIELANPDNNTDYEAELVVIIGQRAKDVSEADALSYVLGYTAGNDVSDRAVQYANGQWIKGKGYDTYLPLGPVIETELDVSDVQVMSRLNGESRQSESTKSLIFSVPHLVSTLSHVMTLETGDVIMTGTPHGVGPMKAGDTIEIEVEGIGVLRNPVVNRS